VTGVKRVGIRRARRGDQKAYRRGSGGDKAWEAAESALREVVGLLKGEGEDREAKDEGQGEDPSLEECQSCHADFIWAVMVHFVWRYSEGEWERMMGFDEILRKQYEACKLWLERDDWMKEQGVVVASDAAVRDICLPRC